MAVTNTHFICRRGEAKGYNFKPQVSHQGEVSPIYSLPRPASWAAIFWEFTPDGPEVTQKCTCCTFNPRKDQCQTMECAGAERKL